MFGHSFIVFSIDYSFDGNRIVSAGWDKSIRIWDTENYCELGPPLLGHGDQVNSVKYSSDATKIVSAGKDKMILLWDAEQRKILKKFKGHWDSIIKTLFTPDD